MKVNRHMRVTAAVVAIALLSGCGVFKGKGGPKTPVVGDRISILTSESGVELDPSIADVQVVLPSPEVNADWAQPGGNAAKSMGHLALGASPQKVWSANIKGSSNSARLASAPVVSDGRVYAIDTDARVHAFDAGTGARVWTASLGSGGNNSALFGGGVSAEGDRLYATTGVGDVVALNTGDGSVIWKKRPGGPLRGSPTLSNGHVYVMSQDNQIFALNAPDGELVWTEAGTLEVTGVFGVAAPAAGQGTVIAGYSSGELTAYRYENGRSLWGDALSRTSISTAVASLADIDADPVIDRGRVYAVGQGGRMASYELVTGQRLWELNAAGISTPWVAGEWLFVVTDEAKLLCVARATGRIRWISQLKHYRKAKKKEKPISWTGPVLAGGRLILVSSEGELDYVNPADGSVQATQELNSGMSLSPVVAGNMLYILDDNGRLTAYR
ncbi:outer membrane protein assembly factor BamB family protein [Rhizorhapis sp. SPR117]|uniref:outer membrane protein assembly factor BamB family protein n=1 Tax=Rhizorhapis sp. SPR117 TaxID=2912611 RepID=UPI001F31D7AE|nr:PQQ-binding-like beta-propeller repeat protein [Rhizorhapis sp. SPR117]